MAPTSTDVDKEALRAAAIARVLTECFSEKERAELVSEALKPLFNDRPRPYGDVEPSVFKKAIEHALQDWTTQAVVEYCQQPDIIDGLKRELAEQCDRVIKERIPGWVDRIIKRADRL